MNKLIGEQLPSKKNLVIRKCGQNQDIVVKKFSDPGRFRTEKEMGDILQDTGLLIPPRLAWDEKEYTIDYSYIAGEPVVDLIEDIEWEKTRAIFTQICDWLVQFYRLTRQKIGCQYILGDIHLRNFIYNETAANVYGLDFEECRPGRIETDAARLWVFILNYDPAFTERKQLLAALVKENLFAALRLEESSFKQEAARETAELMKRRSIRRDSDSKEEEGKSEKSV